MREIKFRAWDRKQKKMFYDVLHNISFDGVVMQYIGLKDKNDKKLYEGDVLVATGKAEMIGLVIFEDGMFRINYGIRFPKGDDRKERFFTSGIDKQWEVIGNIYENPELLNV